MKKPKISPTSRVNALKHGAYGADVASTGGYARALIKALEQLYPSVTVVRPLRRRGKELSDGIETSPQP
jgi:hypothetical protein